jgi:hypothetical protein
MEEFGNARKNNGDVRQIDLQKPCISTQCTQGKRLVLQEETHNSFTEQRIHHV